MEMLGMDWDDLRYGQRFVPLDLPWFGVANLFDCAVHSN